jgi:hypothetical protein
MRKGKLTSRKKRDYKIQEEAGFIYDKVTATATLLRAEISEMVCVRCLKFSFVKVHCTDKNSSFPFDVQFKHYI